MATSPKRPIRLRILGGTGVTNYPNELLADITNKKLTLYDGDGNKTIDFYSELSSSSSGTGNAVTALTVSGNKITITKGSTFLTEHPDITMGTNSTSTASPAHGGTFTAIDGVTKDDNGHLLKVNTKTVTLPSETALSVTSSGTGNAVTAVTVSGHAITLTKGSTFLTAHPSTGVSTDTTSTGTATHGGTIEVVDAVTRDTFGHVKTLNKKTITLPSETSLSVSSSGSGNAVTGVTVSGHAITLTKGSTFLTAHPATSTSSDTTSSASPAVSGSFTAIDSVTRDTYGHVTKVNTKTISLTNINTAISAKATTALYTGTIGTSWSGSSAPYTQTVSISGILATDTPIVDINLSSITYANKDSVTEAWSSIYRITTAANSITVYSDEKTTTSVPIQLKIVR